MKPLSDAGRAPYRSPPYRYKASCCPTNFSCRWLRCGMCGGVRLWWRTCVCLCCVVCTTSYSLHDKLQFIGHNCASGSFVTISFSSVPPLCSLCLRGGSTAQQSPQQVTVNAQIFFKSRHFCLRPSVCYPQTSD